MFRVARLRAMQSLETLWSRMILYWRKGLYRFGAVLWHILNLIESLQTSWRCYRLLVIYELHSQEVLVQNFLAITIFNKLMNMKEHYYPEGRD